MDWAAASKSPFWGAAADVAATDIGPTMLSFAGPSSSSAAAEGQLQDFSVGHVQRARPATAAGRRGRAPGSVVGAEACSVDGCRSDLSRCREYHRRHKVCEVHSKTPVVVVSGQEQRFCQQCSRGELQIDDSYSEIKSIVLVQKLVLKKVGGHVTSYSTYRFHMLSEFDEGKRSCRKRLDGHNRRRRKPQHDAMNPGSIFPYDNVNQYSVYPRTFSIANRSADSLMHPLEHQRFSISFSEFKAPKHFPFLQDGSSILSTACPTLLQPFSSGEDGSYIATTSSRCNGLFRTLDPECALSLLSSSLHLSQGSIPSSADSMVTRIAAVSQAATAATTAFASDGAAPAGDHVLVSDTIFEDPSHALPFSWQV